MKRYLLDTNMMGHFINHRRGVDLKVQAARQQGSKVGICVPVLGELHFGVEASASRDLNLNRLRKALKRLVCWPYDKSAAVLYGRLAADLKRSGRIIQQIDIQIAAIALSLGNCTVVTSDADLSAVPGLAVENWAS